MRLVKDKHFGKTAVRRVIIRKKDGLVLPQTGGMHRARIGFILNGPHYGKFMLYEAHCEEPADYRGARYWFIPDNAVLAEIEPEVDEVVEPYLEVDRHVGEDQDWYGNVA